jgi:hypothetical protein
VELSIIENVVIQEGQEGVTRPTISTFKLVKGKTQWAHLGIF